MLDNTNTQEVDSSQIGSGPGSKIGLWAFMFIIAIVMMVFYVKWSSDQKPTIDQRMQTIKTLRAEKATHLKNIENEQKAIYLIDQKIIPLKCWVFSDVKAETQWDSDCSEYFSEQQSKIQSGSEISDE